MVGAPQRPGAVDSGPGEKPTSHLTDGTEGVAVTPASQQGCKLRQQVPAPGGHSAGAQRPTGSPRCTGRLRLVSCLREALPPRQQSPDHSAYLGVLLARGPVFLPLGGLSSLRLLGGRPRLGLALGLGLHLRLNDDDLEGTAQGGG